ncbi:MAG: 23S rRNA (pseudouridine(1915)-N(3))-methyltransferase RlmH [Peptococcaceae bacterium]|jgi:23S rRNA (pseudouridine1915-N3)-methyltransferase|nr:23S rRNA (pseudouridine(1915)-N(3))-methyltransferase RlmH [Peptococcaceae bacterium]
MGKNSIYRRVAGAGAGADRARGHPNAKIAVVAVGGVKEAHYQAACGEYLKRLRPLLALEMIEAAEEPLPAETDAFIKRALDREGERILRRLRPEDEVVVLSPTGQVMDSLLFADLLGAGMAGAGRLIFVIGSSWGLAPAVYARGGRRLSFGPMTFPHQLARVMLLEQIYRGGMLLAGRAYHK